MADIIAIKKHREFVPQTKRKADMETYRLYKELAAVEESWL